MRKSSRTRKRVELYKPAPFSTIREHPRESSSESEDEDEVDEVPHEVLAPKSRKTTTRKGAAKAKGTGVEGHSSIFDAVSNAKDIDDKASEWLTFLHNNRVGATSELFNFVFMCCGAKKNWLQPTTDLETLDGGELEELLSEMMKDMVASKAHTHYPLIMKKVLRDHYVSFFESVVANQYRLHNSLSTLSPIIDTLIALSSTALTNIRDAVTEASLTILSQCVIIVKNLNERNVLLQRQMTSSQKAKQTNSAKNKHVAGDLSDNSKNIAALSTLSNNLFNGIFIHRYKDTSDVIRWRAVFHLAQWIVTYQDTYMTEEYLKYIGWMLSDPDTDVRLETVEALKAILEVPNVSVSRLQRFIDRFMDRMIEIAACDAHTACSVEMLQAFRVMQRVGLLDTLAQEKLDQLDVVVFDVSSSEEARRESLALMMDHTEGFETPSPQVKTNGRKSDAATFAEHQLHASQCEMLLEFAEYHLQDANPELGKLVAQACLSLPQAAILTDWSVMCSLLLREENALTSFRVTILLNMMLNSAEVLHQQHLHAPKGKNVSVSREWQALQEMIFSSLPKLVHRYRDSVTNLELLLQLYKYYEHRNIPADFFKSIMEVYDVTTEDSCLQTISNLLRSWHDISSSSVVAKHVKALLEKHWTQIQACCDSVTTFVQRDDTGKKSKRSSKNSSMKIGDALHALSATIHRYSLLWRCLDCRDFHSESADVLVSTLQDLERALLEAAPRVPLISGIESALQKSIVHTGHTLYHILLWNTRDIYVQVSSESNIEEMEKIIDTVVDQRDKLAPLLEQWMTLDDVPFNRSLALEGFRLGNDLRVLFPVRFQSVEGLQKLAWNPSRTMVAAMRKVFVEEGQRLGDEMEDVEDGDRRDLAVQLVERLLAPLSRALVTDVDNLNRRQAAAVLLYILNDNPEAQQLVKLWIKRLKEANVVRYLEIQMVALKTFYQDRMVAEHDYSACIALAKKLVITMGVNKVKADLVAPVINFFKAGIDFGLENVDTIMFFGILEIYLRLLPPGALRELGDYLNEKLETTLNKEVADVIFGETSDPAYNAYADFRYKVIGDRRHATIHRRKYSASSKSDLAEKKSRLSDVTNASNQFWESGHSSTPTIVRAYGSKGSRPSPASSFRLSVPETVSEDNEMESNESDEEADEYISQKRKSFERKRKSVSLGLHLEEVDESQAHKRHSAATPGSQGSAPSDLFADLDIRPSRKKYR